MYDGAMTATLERGRPRVGSPKRGVSPLVSTRLEGRAHEALTELSAAIGTSTSQLVREAIDLLLAEYGSLTHQTRARGYSDIRPVNTPISLEELRGPKSGIVRLPNEIDWTPRKAYNLNDKYDLVDFYRIVIREASAAEMANYLDKDTLIRIWPSIALPGKLADTWEAAFHDLRRVEH